MPIRGEVFERKAEFYERLVPRLSGRRFMDGSEEILQVPEAWVRVELPEGLISDVPVRDEHKMHWPVQWDRFVKSSPKCLEPKVPVVKELRPEPEVVAEEPKKKAKK